MFTPRTLGLLAALLLSCSTAPAAQEDASVDGGPAGSERQPIVILMIGDGMGPGQLDAASEFQYGKRGQLFMQSLPQQGQIRTGNLSGITDSAAAATTMATGEFTYNTAIGLDRHGVAAKTLVEEARERGLATGIVSTAYLSHATPAAFSAHHWTRHEPELIAADQARTSGADVMFGGGAQHFSAPLMGEMQSRGYERVTSAAALDALVAGQHDKVIGLFADEHMDYVLARSAESTQPTLPQMSLRSLELLDASERGFFLMIEGARIDMASHESELARTIAETLAFDDAVRVVHQWAEGRDDVTIIVTADHECGGLEIVDSAPMGVLPAVLWRWGMHTNADVAVFAQGEASAVLDGARLDHRWVHASLLAAIAGEEVRAPDRELVANGNLSDLRYQAATQQLQSNFGVGKNQLDGLRVDADEHGLAIGVEGLYEWDKNALVILVDLDYGSSTGPAALSGAFEDRTGAVDSLISNLNIASSPAGFGAELALVSRGGQDPHEEDRWDEAGLRGLTPPYGGASNFGWHGAAINFADRTRAREEPMLPLAESGFESYLRWTTLFPDLPAGVPPGARIAISAMLVNSDGTYLSNQALPPFAIDHDQPGESPVQIPSVVVIELDADLDGAVDEALGVYDSAAGS